MPIKSFREAKYLVVTFPDSYDESVSFYGTEEEALKWYKESSSWTTPVLAKVLEVDIVVKPDEGQ
jgi:hypothetical protein